MKAPQRKENRRVSTRRQVKQRHLLDVTVRARTATAQRTRRIAYWTCMVVLAAVAIGGTCYGVRQGMRRFFWQNPEYKLAEITVAKDGTLTRQQILDAAGIREGVSIFSINLEQAQEKIAMLPQVERAEVQRVLPNKIAINVAERKPVAWITSKAGDDPSTAPDAFLVDRRGVLMKIKNPLAEYLHLTVITGMPTENFDAGQTVNLPELKSALDLIRLVSESALQSRFQVRSIDLSRGYCMVVTNQTHAQITFGLDRVESQLERLAVFLDRVEQSRRELRTINLMVQRNVPVVYAPLDGAMGNEAPPLVSKTDKKGGATAKKPDNSKDKTKPSSTGRTPSKAPKTPMVRKALPVEQSTNTTR